MKYVAISFPHLFTIFPLFSIPSKRNINDFDVLIYFLSPEYKKSFHSLEEACVELKRSIARVDEMGDFVIFLFEYNPAFGRETCSQLVCIFGFLLKGPKLQNAFVLFKEIFEKLIVFQLLVVIFQSKPRISARIFALEMFNHLGHSLIIGGDLFLA